METLIPKKNETIIDEYAYLWDKYTAKFGPKCLIFMQVGGFFEVYQWFDKKKNKMYGNSEKASDLYGWKLGRKNSFEKVGCRTTPYMTGTPDYRFNDNKDFYISKALNDGYHVVVVEQDG